MILLEEKSRRIIVTMSKYWQNKRVLIIFYSVLLSFSLSPTLSLSVRVHMSSVPFFSCVPLLLSVLRTRLRPRSPSQRTTTNRTRNRKRKTKKAAGSTEKKGRAMTRMKDSREERGTPSWNILGVTPKCRSSVFIRNCNNRIYLKQRIIILRRK